MSFYFIANIRINDPAGYEKYLENADEVFSKYRGEYLVVDPDPAVIEGNWDYTKSVLIKFDTREDFNVWYYSDDYQEILKFRLTSAGCDSILAEGIE